MSTLDENRNKVSERGVSLARLNPYEPNKVDARDHRGKKRKKGDYPSWLFWSTSCYPVVFFLLLLVAKGVYLWEFGNSPNSRSSIFDGQHWGNAYVLYNLSALMGACYPFAVVAAAVVPLSCSNYRIDLKLLFFLVNTILWCSCILVLWYDPFNVCWWNLQL